MWHGEESNHNEPVLSLIHISIVKSAEKRLAKVVLNVIRVKDNDLKLSMRDFDVQINHSPQDNMYTKSQTLYQLLECGIHPLIAIKTVGLWGDAEKTFLLSKPYICLLYTSGSSGSDICKKIDEMREESLVGLQVSGKGNPMNYMPSLNKYCGFNMPGVRDQGSRARALTAEELPHLGANNCIGLPNNSDNSG